MFKKFDLAQLSNGLAFFSSGAICWEADNRFSASQTNR